MTGTVTNPTKSRPARRTVRRSATLVGATATVLAATAVLAGPASAEVPIGWGEQEPVDMVFVLGALVGVPVLLFAVITALVYLPGLARGEQVAPGATGPQDQWLGGRRSAGEIAYTPTEGSDSLVGAPDADTAEVDAGGGASARW